MLCGRCRTPMNEIKRSFHKQRKWICPKCGYVTFQKIGKKSKRDSDNREG